MRAAYLVPAKGRGSTLYTVALDSDEKPRAALTLDGHPFHLAHCEWVSNQRLVCQAFGIMRESSSVSDLLPMSRWIAVDADGTNLQSFATRRTEYSRGYFLNDGDVIDYLPNDDGAVLMSRQYTPDAHIGSRAGSDQDGLGVDWVDTRTLKVRQVVAPRKDAFEYLTDGRGVVRVMGVRDLGPGGYHTGKLTFYYRPRNATDWRKLAQFDERDDTGWQPMAVDPDLNIAYGFRRADGRDAVYAIRLDDSREERQVYARPDVDVTGLVRIGRQQRVVGATYVTDRTQAEFFDPPTHQLIASLAKALPPKALVGVTGASADESTLVVLASADNDPGVYYIFNRKSHHLSTFNVARSELEGIPLATMKPLSYPSNDGVSIPAYLTLPPGRESARGLPALVLPHGGPSARDEWGFDWLSQYFAHQGYAVLQPEFRGSAGYGDAWLQQNGFRSWRIAVNDVLAGGHWLVNEGIADPARLAVLGWSYGGYAALQSAVVDPSLFKATIAIAPVTDLPALVEEHRDWADFNLIKRFVGEGPHLREGSPIEHPSSFKMPVLLFHGTFDSNVGYRQSLRLIEKLRTTGVAAELVTFEELDHQLDDATARAELLRKSDDFLRGAFASAPPTH